MIPALFLAGTLALASAAEPQEPERFGDVELSLGGYKPNIDQGLAQKPYETIFGGGRGLVFRADFTKTLFTGFGSLGVGVGLGYFSRSGHGIYAQNAGQGLAGLVSGDTTALHIIPSRLTLTYRFDLLVERFGIPLAPYARVAYDRYWWWVTNGSGNTASYTANGKTTWGTGATNGYSLGGGLAFLLDFVDPTLSRDLDRDTGIHHTYIFVDLTKSFVDNFGSSTSWDLSDAQVTLSGGLIFVF